MVTLLITSVIILGLAAIGIYFWAKPNINGQSNELPLTAPPRALFSEQPTPEPESSENGHEIDWFNRLKDGDLSVLVEMKSLENYPEALDEAVANVTSDAQLTKLASLIATNDLKVNRALAEAMMRSWNDNPNRQTTAKMLHFAALSDDAAVFQTAVENALSVWRERKLTDVSATELQALFNGEYWLLSARVRSSGQGFVLKRTLSSARRELEGTTNN